MLSKIKQAFNQAAHTYNEAASVQHAVGAHLIQCLPNRAYKHIIDLGCGTGHTTQTLATKITFETFHAIDIAPLALAIARNTCKNHAIQFTEADFDQHPFTHNTHLIFSNMALHWAKNLNAVLEHGHKALNHQGIFAFSLPLKHTFHELNGIAARRQLPEYDDILALVKKYFTLIHHETQRYCTSHENTLACLRTIKQTGATFVDGNNENTLTKTILREKNITQLTYDIGFFIGQKTC